MGDMKMNQYRKSRLHEYPPRVCSRWPQDCDDGNGPCPYVRSCGVESCPGIDWDSDGTVSLATKIKHMLPPCPKCWRSGTVEWVEAPSQAGGDPGTPCAGPCVCWRGVREMMRRTRVRSWPSMAWSFIVSKMK